MNELIAYCGLDCEKCDARIATLNHDDALREKTAKLWSELNGAEITPEMINCVGCRVDGVKTPFCNAMCPIRKCAAERKLATCGHCSKMDKCETLGMVTSNNAQALENLNHEAQAVIDKFKEARDIFRDMFRDFDNKDEAVEFLVRKTKISKEECSAAYDIIMKIKD